MIRATDAQRVALFLARGEQIRLSEQGGGGVGGGRRAVLMMFIAIVGCWSAFFAANCTQFSRTGCARDGAPGGVGVGGAPLMVVV